MPARKLAEQHSTTILMRAHKPSDKGYRFTKVDRIARKIIKNSEIVGYAPNLGRSAPHLDFPKPDAPSGDAEMAAELEPDRYGNRTGVLVNPQRQRVVMEAKALERENMAFAIVVEQQDLRLA